MFAALRSIPRYVGQVTATGLEVRLHEGRERAAVTRVARTLTEVVRSLREIDQVHLLRGTRATWVMADMERQDADLVLRLEARLIPSRRSMADVLVPAVALVEGAGRLQSEAAVPRLFSPATVERVGRLAAPHDGVQSVSISTYNGAPGEAVDLSDAVRVNASMAVRTSEISYGSVAGTLSGLRETRGRAVKVTVRETRGRQAIDGYVPGAMAEQLRDAWRHRVLLGGKVRRNARGQAIRIDVDVIERLPEGNASRPTTDDLVGAGAAWLGDMSVDEFIDEVRDA